jgi:proteasome accessory factor C
VFSSEGRWYVAAIDAGLGELRHFRIDRLSAAAPTGETFERPADAPAAPPAQVFRPTDATEVTVVLPASGRWVVESYDLVGEPEDLDDGRIRTRLAVSGERWLERLLLRVGPDAVVEAPPELAGVGAAAARRLLARYDA